jgi:hypothetical protein
MSESLSRTYRCSLQLARNTFLRDANMPTRWNGRGLHSEIIVWRRLGTCRGRQLGVLSIHKYVDTSMLAWASPVFEQRTCVWEEAESQYTKSACVTPNGKTELAIIIWMLDLTMTGPGFHEQQTWNSSSNTQHRTADPQKCDIYEPTLQHSRTCSIDLVNS